MHLRRDAIDFCFDTELIMQAVYFNLWIEEVPAGCRYFARVQGAR